MPDAPAPGYGTLAALVLFIVASVWLGALAQRAVHRGRFLNSYFLGNRGLGAWAIALTATVQSGGTFMGFPSLVYSHGWVLAVWIGSYMVVPITGFSIIGKRFAEISRRTGAITVPDIFRARYDSPRAGLVASLLILFFLTFMLIAQFKAGALVMKVAWPGTGVLALSETEGGLDQAYYLGLAIFTLTVVGYTLIGGFLAAVWTDLFQSVLMFLGVVLLLLLSVPAVGGLETATRQAMANTSPDFAFAPGFARDGREFLTIGLAVSFFVVWPYAGMFSPASMVRVMACRDTQTLRRSIFLLAVYNFFIYLPLIAICVAARVVMPDLANSDEVIPRMALWATREYWGGSFLAGLILAAPFGAIMATVSGYLVVIASGVVRDVYQRWINPDANEAVLRRLSQLVMIGIGLIAVLANLNPPKYLQAVVVFSASGAGASFGVAALMTAYWRRATGPGAVLAMAAGGLTVLTLFLLGWLLPDDPMIGQATAFRPYYLGGMEPIIWGITASLLAGVIGSLLTLPPKAAVVSLVFDARPAKEPS